MLSPNQKLGKQGENIAERYLIKKGYDILARHYTSRFGEIDLVAKDKEKLVFIEVKSRSSQKFGFPEEAVTPQKLSRLIRTIYCYLEKHCPQCEDFRIDVISLVFSKNREVPAVLHWKNISLPLEREPDDQFYLTP